ncbi:MAG TPA: S8 family serine peptidase [Thermoanaerobaculia bacterium]
MSTFRSAVPLLVALAIPLAVDAGPRPQADRTKILVEEERAGASPLDARALGAEEVAAYDSYRVLALPAAAADRVIEQLRERGLRVSRRDDFDVLALPGGALDTRRGVDLAVPSSRLIHGYGAGVHGLHVVQLIAPPSAAWVEQLDAAGAEIVSYVPQNGYLIAATREAAGAIEALPFVQWVSPFHPHFKAKPAKLDTGLVPVEIENADVRDAGETLAELRRLDPQAKETGRFARRISLVATLPAAAVERLLADARVVGISPQANLRVSDERQVMGTTNNTTAFGSQPTNPTTYRTWLGTICSFCNNMLSQNWYAGIADTGVDSGSAGTTRHPDLANPSTKIRFGRNFYAPTLQDADRVGHGTMVAGIIAGDASTFARDNGGSGFYLGMGMVPTAGIFSTKAADDRGEVQGAISIFDIIVDATNNGVFFQNHSYNDYRPNVDGTYSARSAQVDAAVRDSNGATAGGAPITLSVSAGNKDLPTSRPNLGTLPHATAKNVLAIGGSENFRIAAEQVPNCRGVFADGFNIISNYAKWGTNVNPISPDGQKRQWSTYIKPDLTAPMTFIVSARSPVFGGYCNTNFLGQPYIQESGTSFASPVGLGAALLASRVYAQFRNQPRNSALASPALVKAMLTSTARSMEGGVVRATNTVLGPRPDDIQGFGHVYTPDILDSTIAKTYVNQTHTFTGSGQASWNAVYFRRNTSRPVRIGLTWTDAPAVADSTAPLMNDLDLTVNKPVSNPQIGTRVPCAVNYYGNNIASGDNSIGVPCGASVFGVGQDYRNATEIFSLQPGSAFTALYVKVNPKQVGAQGNAAIAGPNQDFALYAWNASQRGDFNHDGKADLLWRNATADNRPAVWLDTAVAARTFLGALAYPWRIEGVGDFDQNGSDDLVIRNPQTGEIQLRLLNKLATINTVAVATAGTAWEVAGAGDFNQDGNLDILLRNYGSGANQGKLEIWKMLGTARYEITPLPALTTLDLQWRLEGTADFNGDGHFDYLFHHLGTGQVQLWYMQNATRLSIANAGTIGAGTWRAGAVGDYNHDSINDIVWRNQSTGATLAWFGNRTGFPTSGALATEPALGWALAGPR